MPVAATITVSALSQRQRAEDDPHAMGAQSGARGHINKDMELEKNGH